MKIALIDESSIPVIYNSLCYWNAQCIQHEGSPDAEALKVINAIEDQFQYLFEQGKIIYTP